MHPRVVLEGIVAGEGSRFGFAPDSLRAEMETLLELPRLNIDGLMTIPPSPPEAEASRKHFRTTNYYAISLRAVPGHVAATSGNERRFSCGD